MNKLENITDADGFLLDAQSWDKALAETLAQSIDIELTDAHWEVIFAMREFYDQFDFAPPMRAFCKFLKTELGADKSSSMYLLTLFPDSPAKLAAKIAGLPKPDHCL